MEEALFKCEKCNITCSTEAQYKHHLESKKHRTYGHGILQQFLYIESECDNLGEENNKEQIRAFLSKHGTPKDYYTYKSGSCVKVKFEEEEPVQKLLKIGHFNLVSGKEVKIKKSNASAMRAKSDDNFMLSTDLRRKLLNSFTVEQQIDTLVKEIELDEKDITNRETVCNELQDVLRAYLPHTTVVPFGSSASGLGVKGCDLDITVMLNLDEYKSEEEYVSEKVFPDLGQTDITASDLQNPETKVINVEKIKEFIKARPGDKMHLILKLIRNQSTGFTIYRVILQSRVPVLKAEYHSTQCDITCENGLGLQNTNLLRLYQDIDPRVRPLLYAVKVWGSSVGISGSGYGPKLINYCLHLLVVYYLQNTQPPVLPTIKELADLADISERVTMDSYDASFTTDISRISRTTNYSSTAKLLYGFFQFCSNFDFTYYVICPRIGQVVPVLEIDDYFTYCEGMDFKPKVIHVQDPFVLDQNIAENVEKTVLDKIWSACKRCVNIVNKPDFGEGGASKEWGFLELIKDIPPVKSSKPKAAENVDDKDKVPEVHSRILPEKKESYYFELPLNANPKLFTSWQLSDQANILALKHWWTYRVVEGLIGILEGPYQCNIITEEDKIQELESVYKSLEAQRIKKEWVQMEEQQSNEEPPSKRQKTENDSSVNNGEITPERTNTEPETMDSNETNDGLNEKNVTKDSTKKKNNDRFTPPVSGIYYRPPEKGMLLYQFEPLPIFSVGRYREKQLLCSVECKLFSRLDDIFYTRNKIRKQLVENGWVNDLTDTTKFCDFECEVTNIALCDVAVMRPSGYNVIEASPVMDFSTRFSIVNKPKDEMVLEIAVVNNKKESYSPKVRPKGGFDEKLATTLRGMLLKLVKNFP